VPGEVTEGDDLEPPRGRLGGDPEPGDAVLTDFEDRRDVLLEDRRGPGVRPFENGVVGVDRLELGGPKVEVWAKERIRLEGRRPSELEGGAPIGREPVGLSGGKTLDVRGVEAKGELRRQSPGGSGGGGFGRCGRGGRGNDRCRFGGRLGHPSDPSISSFTSRLNSIAYSMGSSFVKTSRKP